MRRLIWWSLWACLLLSLLAVATLGGLLWYYGRDLPHLITVQDYKPAQASMVLARDGTVLAHFGLERRTVVPMTKIPAIMRQAIIASEDAEFYSHKGLDYPGMLRALFATLRAGGKITQGGSTITQQLVKALILTPERTVSRKVKEIILARRLETNLSKDDILFLYLNQVYMGHGSYGVEAASRFFFDHGVERLSAAEAALLAGLVQSPERLSPIRHPEAARNRRNYVLREMVKCGYLDQERARQIDEGPLGVVARPRDRVELAPHFVEALRLQVQRELGQEELLQGGLRIRTTLDPRLQAMANAAVIAGLDQLDARQQPLRGLKVAPAQAKRLLAEEVRGRGHRPPQPGRIVRGLVERFDRGRQAYLFDLGGGARGQLALATLGRYAQPGRGRKEPVTPELLFQPGDLVRVRIYAEATPEDPFLVLQPALGPEAALVALEPHHREVLALVGGDPRLPGRFDRVLQARRQPGSAFKPVVYTAALGLRRADLTLATLIDDSPNVYVGANGKQWAPQNFDRKFRGPIPMRDALTHSVNMVAIKLLKEVGVDRVISLAHDLGITSDLDPYLPLALGASAVRPIELANAYATLAAGGKVAEPVLLRRIDGPDGAVLFEAAVQPVQVLPADLACLATDMLTSVVEEGTARRAKKLGRPVAGKTGTTNDQTDTWFAGFVPHLVAVVWVGHDDNFPLGRGEQGGATALPIWLAFMKAALEGRPVEDFPPCPDLVTRTIDRKTGLLAPADLPASQTRVEKFLKGTEPREETPQPGELSLDNFLLEQTGKTPESAPDPPPFEGPPLPPSPDRPPLTAPAPPGDRRSAPAGATVPAPAWEEPEEPMDDDDLPE